MDQAQQLALFYQKAALQLHSFLSASQDKAQLASVFLQQQEISWQTWLTHLLQHSAHELTALSIIKFAKEWLLFEGAALNLFINNFTVLKSLSESSESELETLALVFIRDFICTLFDEPQFIQTVSDHLLSELFTLVISQLHSPSTGTAQNAKLAFLSFASSQGGRSIILHKAEAISTLFETGLHNLDSTVQIRFMVVLVELANLCQEYFQILEALLRKVVDRILKQEDLLVKLNVIELIPLLSRSHRGRQLMNQTDLLTKYLKDAGDDPFGLVDHTVILLIAVMISRHWDEFNHLINEAYLTFLFKNGKSANQVDRKCFLESIGLIFENKLAYSQFYKAKGLLKLYLSLASTTIESEKILFFDSLAKLLSLRNQEDLKEQDQVFTLFANLADQTFVQTPCSEKLVKSIEFIVSSTEVPFEGQELAVLLILQELLNWKTGYSLIFKSSKTLSYLLTRSVKAKEVVELKFTVIEKILTDSKAKQIDQGLIEQFKKYHQQGVYGQLAEKAIDPSLITEIS